MIIVNILTVLCIVIGVGFCLYLCGGILIYVFKGIKKAIDEYKDEISSKKVSETPTITFEQFKSFYAVNPDKWKCHDTYVRYGREVYYELPGYMNRRYGENYVYHNEDDIPYYTEVQYIDIGFKTKTDLKRYKKWKLKQENAKKRETANKTYTLILEDVQKDVQKRMKEIESETKKELERIKAERTKNEKRFIDLISNKDLSFTSTEDTSSQLKSLSCNCINIMYQGNLCELFSDDRTGDIYVKMPNNDFVLLRDLTPTPSIYFKEQDAYLLEDIRKDLNKV